MTRTRIVGAVLTAVLLAGPTEAAKNPAWIKAPDLHGYYSGVGAVAATSDRAQDIIRAQEAAVANLSASVESSVRASFSQEIQETNDGGIVSSFSSSTSLETTLSLPGVRVVARHYNKKQKLHYCLVRVPVEEVQDFQRRNYEEAVAHAASVEDRLREHIANADLLQYLNSAVSLLIYYDKVVASGTLGASHRMLLVTSADRVINQIQEAIAKVSINVLPFGPVPAKTQIDSAIIVSCTYDGRPLEGVPLEASFIDGKGYGEISISNRTDTAGTALLLLSAVNSISTENAIQISIGPFWDDIPARIGKALPPTPTSVVRFESFDPKSQITCAVIVLNGSRALDNLQSRLADAIDRTGFAVSVGEPLAAATGDLLRVELRADILSKEMIRGNYSYESELVWSVSDLDGATCRSGKVRLSLIEKNDVRFDRSFQTKAYSKVRGELDEAIRRCSSN